MKPNRREFLSSSVALAGLAQAAPQGVRRPNILLITDDQHNARNLGCYGDKLVRTPVLDKLAARGVRFTHGYTTNMICAPARVSMVTGQYVHSHGYYGNSGPHPGRPLWVTSHLRRNGYQTAMVGKAHYGWPKVAEEFDYIKLCDRIDCSPDDPLKNDYFRMLLEKGQVRRSDDSQRRGTNNPARSDLPEELSVEAWTSDNAIDFLRKRDKSRPCFCFVSFQRPHAPITPPAPYDTMYKPSDVPLPPSVHDTFDNKPAEQLAAAKRSIYPYHPTDLTKLQQIMAMYFGLITLIDSHIGRILAELDAQNLTNDTLILFTADHGDFSGEHGFFHKNLAMYEAIHHIPFIMAGPGIESGVVRDEFVQLTDIYPTACEFAGLPIPESVQGLSLLPLGRPNPGAWQRTAAFAEEEGRMCIRTSRYRMVFDPIGSANELYDHSDDPWEIKNRYDDPAYSKARQQLADDFLRYWARTQQQTLATSLSKGGGGGYMPPGPTHDLWWGRMDWDTVQKKYNLKDPRPKQPVR
jgi:arylsulfatase A-like enzyme